MPRLSRGTFPAALADPAQVRQITKGPGFHWFGYYDKLQFDPAGRSSIATGTIKVGMVETGVKDRGRAA